ncbi:bifunctional N(6)-L-threonylcarbamoyladenine synthase/serine/threonine protein kinase [Candidatus Bathyarchaeota archaeon]|nr:bifunctional N(6)-L-threonylcarbamoyladenine synthase/serine/threonine protein kinase [Candidatus Bathyarchaeota archaeon]
MLILGLESTAHTFSAGIVDDAGNVLNLVSDTYIPETGGLHPLKTAMHHQDCFDGVISTTVKEAKVSIRDIDLIAFSQGPGLGPCLRIGATIARTLSAGLRIPMVGVNHCVAHVEIGRVACGCDDPLCLYVSGGNTIISALKCGRYQVFGETLDIALGNMLDTFAREAGLAHPGGPKIEQLARKSDLLLDLPYVVKGMDLSFSGILTSAIRLLAKHDLEDIANSLQETTFAMLAEVTERAVAHTGKEEVLLTGGVAANDRLKKMIDIVALEQDASFHVVPRKLAGDNGAMIAWTGFLQFDQGNTTSLEESRVMPNWRLDQVDIPWRQER